ncbi:ATP-dependent DNA helicase RecQ, partial [Salmonella enterica subsp. enterica serovar Typhi]|nr:ATP-dependent DNA helicase RecQ [Salmonella enterica subsp. enterica serovar Typhi]
LSEWGHEFRTSYLALSGTIKKYAPSARFLALTATASSKVLQDIRNELEIDTNNVITISRFTRDELKFNVIPVTQQERNELLIQHLIRFKEQHSDRASLVFTANVNGKSGCFELHHMIHNATGLRTGFYSGGQPKNWITNSSQSFADYKDSIQHRFMEDQVDVMVATKAFGMGIDKPNIGLTLHYGIPGSLESYYQEAGRAGRDKHDSNCVILYNPDHLDERKMQSLFGVQTAIDVINTEKSQLKGDLSTQLYFLTLNLKDIEAEMHEIYAFYESVVETNPSQTEVLLGFHNDGERENMERYVYRLALIGVVADWTIDWRMRRIEVVLEDWNQNSVTERILTHIQKYEYTFTLTPDDRYAEQYMEYINHFNNEEIPFLKRALYVLLRWYNDNVVYS